MTRKNVRPPKSSLGSCFTIMPFGGHFDSYYSKIYCQAIRNCNLEPRRVDDLFRSSSIVRDIWDLTKKAKVILADLTGKNPNVLYELGLAHAITKPAILVAQSLDDIPFDLKDLRIILYDKNEHNWGQRLKVKIENALKETLASPGEALSPVFARGTEVTSEAKELQDIRKDLDIIKRGMGLNTADVAVSYDGSRDSVATRKNDKLYVTRKFMELLKNRVAVTDDLNEVKKKLLDRLQEEDQADPLIR
jgi:hypothetical protein